MNTHTYTTTLTSLSPLLLAALLPRQIFCEKFEKLFWIF